MTGTMLLPREAIDRLAAGFDGRFGFYIEDLQSGVCHAGRADERFPTASVCKITVLIELFRQVEKGELALDERRRSAPQAARDLLERFLRRGPLGGSS